MGSLGDEGDEMSECNHNQRCRYTHGFHCEGCKTFFGRDTPTYRKEELLSSIWMVLNNINVNRGRNDLPKDPEVQEMKDKIGIGIDHDDYEELIAASELIMSKYGKDGESASITMR